MAWGPSTCLPVFSGGGASSISPELPGGSGDRRAMKPGHAAHRRDGGLEVAPPPRVPRPRRREACRDTARPSGQRRRLCDRPRALRRGPPARRVAAHCRPQCAAADARAFLEDIAQVVVGTFAPLRDRCGDIGLDRRGRGGSRGSRGGPELVQAGHERRPLGRGRLEAARGLSAEVPHLIRRDGAGSPSPLDLVERSRKLGEECERASAGHRRQLSLAVG
jgi:hypothetical protein